MNRYKNLLFFALLCFSQFLLAVKPQPLRFNSSGTFKIVQFTDTHLGFDRPNSVETIITMRSVLDAEKPDLVIFTGDNVTYTPVIQGLNMLVEPVASRHIPYIMVFGNHDSEPKMGISRRDLGKLISQLPGYYDQPTVKNISGVTNYVLEIKSQKDTKTGALLYCLDSNDYDTIAGKRGYAGVAADQVEWYRTASKKYTENNQNQPIPALMFFHIPLIEYASITDTSHCYTGSYLEHPCPAYINTGLFAAMVKSGDVMGCFVGHDHNNDYIFNYFGIALGYGHFTGSKNTYTGMDNGARIIVLQEGKREFTTWVRLSTGPAKNVIHYPEGLPFIFKPQD